MQPRSISIETFFSYKCSLFLLIALKIYFKRSSHFKPVNSVELRVNLIL